MNPTRKQFSLNRGASRKQIPISNDLSLYGSKFFETPHIDALARLGMKFTRAYSASPRG